MSEKENSRAVRSRRKTGSRQDEVLHGRREEQRQRRSGDECASRFRDLSEKLASGGPVDVAERESGQQQARNRDGDFAQRAPEKHDGQRQQDQERRCGRGDERQQSDVERGAEDGVEAESVAVRTAEILRGEGQAGPMRRRSSGSRRRRRGRRRSLRRAGWRDRFRRSRGCSVR